MGTIIGLGCFLVRLGCLGDGLGRGLVVYRFGLFYGCCGLRVRTNGAGALTLVPCFTFTLVPDYSHGSPAYSNIPTLPTFTTPAPPPHHGLPSLSLCLRRRQTAKTFFFFLALYSKAYFLAVRPLQRHEFSFAVFFSLFTFNFNVCGLFYTLVGKWVWQVGIVILLVC